eukprot:354062-Chlamydomonas_euryale.AAC.2
MLSAASCLVVHLLRRTWGERLWKASKTPKEIPTRHNTGSWHMASKGQRMGSTWAAWAGTWTAPATTGQHMDSTWAAQANAGQHRPAPASTWAAHVQHMGITWAANGQHSTGAAWPEKLQRWRACAVRCKRRCPQVVKGAMCHACAAACRGAVHVRTCTAA